MIPLSGTRICDESGEVFTLSESPSASTDVTGDDVVKESVFCSILTGSFNELLSVDTEMTASGLFDDVIGAVTVVAL